MQNLEALNKKIEDLKKKKIELEVKTAITLFKKIKTILGDDFSSDIALAIIEDSWTNKSHKSMEVWQAKANTFQKTFRGSPKVAKTTQPGAKKLEQTAA